MAAGIDAPAAEAAAVHMCSVLTLKEKRDIVDVASKLQTCVYSCHDLPPPQHTFFLDIVVEYATLNKRLALQV